MAAFLLLLLIRETLADCSSYDLCFNQWRVRCGDGDIATPSVDGQLYLGLTGDFTLTLGRWLAFDLAAEHNPQFVNETGKWICSQCVHLSQKAFQGDRCTVTCVSLDFCEQEQHDNDSALKWIGLCALTIIFLAGCCFCGCQRSRRNFSAINLQSWPDN